MRVSAAEGFEDTFEIKSFVFVCTTEAGDEVQFELHITGDGGEHFIY